VLLSSGYIAGGTLCGLLIGFLVMLLPRSFIDALNLSGYLGDAYVAEGAHWPKIVALAVFAVLAVILWQVGSRKTPVENSEVRVPAP
jgi:membrane protein implicated in regulation of membrane protease activity